MQFIDLKSQQALIKPELNRRMADVLQHSQYIMGPEVAELEQRLAEFVGVKYCISVSSGTDALLIALMGLGVTAGDEVITSAFSFAATVEVIIRLGAKPVLVDVNPTTTNLDTELLEASITNNTKAIMPVSLYGQCAELDTINAIAKRNGNIPVIEDAAQSFGASIDGKRSCSFSTIACTSFFPSKPLGCYGDGGAIFTDDQQLHDTIVEIRNHGQSQRYVHSRIGVGGRMDTLQCAIVLAKLTYFEDELASRNFIGMQYTQQIHKQITGARKLDRSEAGQRLPNLRTLATLEDYNHVYAQYTLLVPSRDAFQEYLLKQSIPTMVHYPRALNEQPAYKDLYKNQNFPVSEWLARHVVSLPMGPYLSASDQRHIMTAIGNAASQS